MSRIEYSSARTITPAPGESIRIDAMEVIDEAVYVRVIPADRWTARDGSEWLDAEGWGWVCTLGEWPALLGPNPEGSG